jgi:WD40 repeat protein
MIQAKFLPLLRKMKRITRPFLKKSFNRQTNCYHNRFYNVKNKLMLFEDYPAITNKLQD